VALCEAAETMVKLANKSVDRLLLSEYLGNYKNGYQIEAKNKPDTNASLLFLIGLI
jgi:hypothetical protein